MSKSDELKNEVKKIISKITDDGHRFSVSLDEWTSPRNRRYVNINVHSPLLEKGFINLGLSKIIGCGSASNCFNIIEGEAGLFWTIFR